MFSFSTDKNQVALMPKRILEMVLVIQTKNQNAQDSRTLLSRESRELHEQSWGIKQIGRIENTRHRSIHAKNNIKDRGQSPDQIG